MEEPGPREEAGEDGGRNELLTARVMLSGFQRSRNSRDGRLADSVRDSIVIEIYQWGGRPNESPGALESHR